MTDDEPESAAELQKAKADAWDEGYQAATTVVGKTVTQFVPNPLPDYAGTMQRITRIILPVNPYLPRVGPVGTEQKK